jgi:hypothetical protein
VAASNHKDQPTFSTVFHGDKHHLPVTNTIVLRSGGGVCVCGRGGKGENETKATCLLPTRLSM